MRAPSPERAKLTSDPVGHSAQIWSADSAVSEQPATLPSVSSLCSVNVFPSSCEMARTWRGDWSEIRSSRPQTPRPRPISANPFCVICVASGNGPVVRADVPVP